MDFTILCGISGAGKSTLFKDTEALVCSADDYFMEDGEYNFDPSKLSDAHGACLRKCLGGVAGQFDIVIDNTNTTVAEIAPYAAIALAYGYDLAIIKINCDVDTAFKRNKHGTPKEVIEAQATRLASLDLPPWWPIREH